MADVTPHIAFIGRLFGPAGTLVIDIFIFIGSLFDAARPVSLSVISWNHSTVYSSHLMNLIAIQLHVSQSVS